jgi:bifunctional non-homologous end joining protein LigD
VTIEMAKARRGTRMYIDTNQNGFGKTIASVYSIRPVPGATVSTPVSWDEVAGGIDPGVFTMAQVAARIQNGTDLFAGVLRRDQDLAAVIEAM